MVHKYDTKRAVGLLKQYQESLTTPEEQSLKTSVEKVSSIFGSHLFQALLDIQECYEVTLQMNAVPNGVKERSPVDTLENLNEEGVSRVLVTSRRSPQKVERVSGLVSRSHVETPKHPQRHVAAQCLQALQIQMSRDLTREMWMGVWVWSQVVAEERGTAVLRRKSLHCLDQSAGCLQGNSVLLTARLGDAGQNVVSCLPHIRKEDEGYVVLGRDEERAAESGGGWGSVPRAGAVQRS